MVIVTVSYISSVCLIIRFTPNNILFDELTIFGEVAYGHVVDNKSKDRNVCISDSFGIPSSLVEAECLRDGCINVTCDQLFAGDAAAVMAARNFNRKSLLDDEVYKLASDCNKLHHLGEYQLTPVRATDLEFPIAFTMLLHLNAEQFERLLRAIYRPQNVYCVHVDTKSPESFQSAVKAIVNCFDNVFLATNLHRVVYGGPSRLQVCENFVDVTCSYNVSIVCRWCCVISSIREITFLLWYLVFLSEGLLKDMDDIL